MTFHHNYYENCASRLPLGRQANMHMYNNYYYKSTGTNMSIRANGYAFVENCYVEACNNPFETKGTGVIKLYGTTIVSSKGTNTAVVASSREEYVKTAICIAIVLIQIQVYFIMIQQIKNKCILFNISFSS